MLNPFVTYPQRPLTPSELLRLGAAMQPFGLPFGAGFEDQEIWIVMEREIPHRLLGLVSTRDAAEAIRSNSGRAEEVDVYGPFAPPPTMIRGTAARRLDKTDPSEHNDTMMVRIQGVVVYPTTHDLYDGGREHAEIQNMTLIINWKPRGDLVTQAMFPIDPQSDAIFLTRASREAFAYPRYLSIFGPDYLDYLRQDLREL